MALEKLNVIDSENDGQNGYFIGIKRKKFKCFEDNKIVIDKSDIAY